MTEEQARDHWVDFYATYEGTWCDIYGTAPRPSDSEEYWEERGAWD